MSASTRVFVYGTLKRGCTNHGFLARERFLGKARTVPGYRLYAVASYPGMVAEAGAGAVKGEVYAVRPLCLRALDQLEGIDEGLYTRQPIALQAPFAEQMVETYLYLPPVEDCRPLGSTWPGD